MAMVDATLEGGTFPPTKLGNTLYTAYLHKVTGREGNGRVGLWHRREGNGKVGLWHRRNRVNHCCSIPGIPFTCRVQDKDDTPPGTSLL